MSINKRLTFNKSFTRQNEIPDCCTSIPLLMMCNHTILNYKILRYEIHLYQKKISTFACMNLYKLNRLNLWKLQVIQNLNDYLK